MGYLPGQGRSQANLPGFGRGVGYPERPGYGVGRHIDNRPRALRQHIGQRRPAAPQRRPETLVNFRLNLFRRIVVERLKPDRPAGHISQNINPAILGNGGRHKPLGLFPPRQLAQGHYRRAAKIPDFVPHPVRGFGYHIADNDSRPLLGQAAGRSRANALAGSRYHRHLPLKPPRPRRLAIQYPLLHLLHCPLLAGRLPG